MKRLVLWLIAVVLASSCACAAEPPTADQLLKKVTAAYGAMKSFEADMEQVHAGGGAIATESGHLIVERAQVEGKTIEKASYVGKRTVKHEGKEMAHELRVVNDGVFTWVESRDLQSGAVTVDKVDSLKPGGFRPTERLVRDLRGDWKVFGPQVVGEEVVNGRKTHVLEGARTTDLPGPVRPQSRLKVWVGQDDSLVRRIFHEVQEGDKGAPTTDMTEYLNVAVDRKIDPALFVYAPPAGARVSDRTKPKP